MNRVEALILVESDMFQYTRIESVLSFPSFSTSLNSSFTFTSGSSKISADDLEIHQEYCMCDEPCRS